MLHAPVTEKKAENGQTQQPLTPLPERERYPLSVEASGRQSPVGNGSGSTLQSAAALYRSHVGSLQRLYGNQAVLQMRSGSRGQIPHSMSMRPSQSGFLLQRKCACGGVAGISGECQECSKKHQTLQRFSLSPNGKGTEDEGAVPPIVHEVLRSPGQPLDQTTRDFFEPRFGHDFSSVHVHTDGRAAASAVAIGASAYTSGLNIAFAAGRYEPATPSGRRLLAHELTHVIQQGSQDGRLARLPLTVSGPSNPAEAEAERTADEVLMGPGSGGARNISARIFQRVSRTIQRQTCTPADANDVPSGLKLTGFKQGSFILPEKHYATLQALAARLKRGEGSGEVQVHGFASQEGDADFNVKLSCTRTFGVKQVIQANGVHNPLTLVAHGATKVVGDTDDDNRAVIVVEPSTSTTPVKEKTKEEKMEPGTEGGVIPAQLCAPDPSCPPDYCTPFATKKEAENDRAAKAKSVLSGLPISRTQPLFREFIFGGGPLRDISAEFGKDFTNSQATIATTRELTKSLEDAIKASPPSFPPGSTEVTLNIKDVLNEGTLKQIMDRMTFSNPVEVPALLAGGIGTNQSKCRIGAMPSDQDDARLVEGTVSVTKSEGGIPSISPPNITFTVKDTIDFCPGFCGTGHFAFNLTVPMSRWEASGISGDVPFIVRFPAPLGSAGSEE